MTGAIRKVLTEKPGEFDLRAYMKEARNAMQKVCEERMIAFGQAGHAFDVPIVTKEEMAKAYMEGKYGDNAIPGKPYVK